MGAKINDGLYKESINEINYAKELSIKIVQGEKLVLEEERLLAEKYPEYKIMAERALEDSKKLRELIKECRSEKEVQQELSKATIKVKVMFKSGFLTEYQNRIKMEAIKAVKRNIIYLNLSK
ncbi:MAG: hypothetical protein ACRC92_09105 [Peptostreptococcaceae bacterium]